MRPKRSLKIDATKMTNFPMDFAVYLQCSAAEPDMSQLLCEALTDSAPINNSGEGKLAKVTAMVSDMAEQYVCNPGNAIAFSNQIEMRDAEEHKVLRKKPFNKSGNPCPILIIDDFYLNTEANKDFIRVLLRDAGAKGVIVFLMTKDRDWASELIHLNSGLKCKPLPTNVDNPGYTGVLRFTETPEWNDLFWRVEKLRDYVRPLCEKLNVNPSEAIPDGMQLTPGEANEWKSDKVHCLTWRLA
jgi:hypothetical protein